MAICIMADPEKTNARYVEQFLEMMSAERGASKNTLESYERDLAAYLSFAGECNADVKSIT